MKNNEKENAKSKDNSIITTTAEKHKLEKKMHNMTNAEKHKAKQRLCKFSSYNW